MAKWRITTYGTNAVPGNEVTIEADAFQFLGHDKQFIEFHTGSVVMHHETVLMLPSAHVIRVDRLAPDS